ncbi:MAG: glycosyltransferase family 39 protein [Spirochaetales bacterium]|nr:glycosyltransferase family 39 protein [Spirochaetales bacterium]
MIINWYKNKSIEINGLVGTLVLAKIAIHLILAERYGFHGDELYFIECARHLSTGYVDHGPFVVWLTAATRFLLGESLFALRLLPALAGGLGLWLTTRMVHLMGGGKFAELVAGLVFILAPAFLRMHGLMHLPAFELLFWSFNALLLMRIFTGGSTHLWWLVGLSTGSGLLNKHTMLIWIAALGLTILGTQTGRKQLRSPDLWGGALLALALFAPNIYWQLTTGWPTLAFIQSMRTGFAREVPAVLFVLGQVLYLGPALAFVWVAGLASLLWGAQRNFRATGLIYIITFAIFLLTGGKPYYLSAAYPPLIAAGAVFWERRARAADGKDRNNFRPVNSLQKAIIILILVGGTITAIPGVPIISLPAMNRYVSFLLGFAIKDPRMLTHDFHGQYGWEDQAKTVARLFLKLPVEQQSRTAILAGNYSQAAAFNIYRPESLPRAKSGHMTYYYWGAPDPAADSFLVYGFPGEFLEMKFRSVVLLGESDHPLTYLRDRHLPIYLCQGPYRHPSLDWVSYRRFGFHPY